jgi:hypothetical protein
MVFFTRPGIYVVPKRADRGETLQSISMVAGFLGRQRCAGIRICYLVWISSQLPLLLKTWKNA